MSNKGKAFESFFFPMMRLIIIITFVIYYKGDRCDIYHINIY